jgi:hypothetical protein
VEAFEPASPPEFYKEKLLSFILKAGSYLIGNTANLR